ncbi:MAG TPA: hypothetical protein VL443_27415 [Cyclobacteriaceae bacterium]|nr:hypothetical protein [Cyclobacteriaceae bacterium]
MNSGSSDSKETLIPEKLDEAEQPTMLLEKPSVAEERPEIPEHIFIEYAKPNLKEPMDQNEEKQDVSDLQTLYRYLEQNQDKKGYEDALINPDSSYMEEQVTYINNELSLLISKIRTYYVRHLRNIDFHIDTRKRNGMLETVDELLTHKETVLEEMRIVSSIEEDSRNGKGLSQNPILSYRKGFRNGFAAITYNTVLSKHK